MTIRELVHELTRSEINWDSEVTVKVASKSVKSGESISWENYKINRVNLFTPIWYIGDECILTIGEIK